MKPIEENARVFLTSDRIAIAGVSRQSSKTGNLIYRQLKKERYQVFEANSQADAVEGHICYPNMAAIAVDVDGAIIVTRPEITAEVVRECPEAGIPGV